MVFNGHTRQYVDTIDEELFTEIQVMYADGLLGNKGIFDALTPITTGIYNYLRTQGSATVKAEQIFPWVQEYSTDPDNDTTPSDALFTYVTQAKGFKVERFQHGV
jgi:hypothetical protein